MDQAVYTMVKERGLTIYDYFAREELAVANAVPTAEGPSSWQWSICPSPFTAPRSW